MKSASQPNSACFAVPHSEALPVATLRLNDRDCEALAELLPVLICGEESASLVFARLSKEPHLSAAHDELARIEREESGHARWLSQIRLALPAPRTDTALSRATKLFFLRMREQEAGRHFARIAALDSGVCVLLGALRRRRTPTASQPTLNSLFARIHHDEARHVLIARQHARVLTGSKQASDVAHDTRQRLIQSLLHRAAALEQLLCIDAEQVVRAIAQSAAWLVCMNALPAIHLHTGAARHPEKSGNVWRDPRTCAVLGMGRALPGEALSTQQLLARIKQNFDVDVRRSGAIAARRLGVEARHVCREFVARGEQPRAGHSNAELAAQALQNALQDAGLTGNDLAFLIGHTATPGQPLPPNIALVAELIGYDGPFVELRQACTGFANALIMARSMLDAPNSGPIAIVGSETGSVFFDPLRAAEDHGQLVNLLQMGDGAAACVLGHTRRHGAQLSNIYFGQIGRGRSPGFELKTGGSNRAAAARDIPEFAHDFSAVREHGPLLFEQGIAAAAAMGIDVSQVDYIIPHQANGQMAQLLAPRLGVNAQRIFVNADRVGNTGSAAIWLALTELRSQLHHGQRVLILGAEATKHMFGGMLYVHG